jgi:hypothetical protein
LGRATWNSGALAALLLAASGPVWAVDPFEIQVYEGDINGPGQVGLEIHVNAVPSGHSTIEPPAQVAADDLVRLTLEPSLGLLEWWELGAYLQFAFQPGERSSHFGGFKLRSKWIVPRRLTGHLRVGLNVEVGRGRAALGTGSWDTEFRPVLVWSSNRLMLAANPMIGWALTGPQRDLEPDLEPAFKVRVNGDLGVGVGLEYYAGIGRLSSLPAAPEQEHVLYLVGDLLDAAFDANLGVGRGLTGAADEWTIKAILGVGF